MPKPSDTRPLTPAPAKLKVQIGGKEHILTYEQAFLLASLHVEKKHFEDAARIFEQLQKFTDRGPRACIMRAFCEAAAMHFDRCSGPLAATFDNGNQSLAADLHNAFISYHVGIRQDAIASLTELVNRNHELPSVCLLLGDMLRATGNAEMARRCWSLAIKRDWPNGGVALAAARRIQSTANKRPSRS